MLHTWLEPGPGLAFLPPGAEPAAVSRLVARGPGPCVLQLASGLSVSKKQTFVEMRKSNVRNEWYFRKYYQRVRSGTSGSLVVCWRQPVLSEHASVRGSREGTQAMTFIPGVSVLCCRRGGAEPPTVSQDSAG